MAISTVDQLVGAAKQRVRWSKTGAIATLANIFYSPFAAAGQPGAGVLAGTNTAAGIVPTDATAGYPTLNSITGKGYLSRVEASSSVVCQIALYDRLFQAGAYAFNANTTLASQPSYASRVPDTDYKGLELWAEQVTVGTLIQNVTVGYTDQDGNSGASTGAVAAGAAAAVGRCWQLPLASGDDGIQRVDSVLGTVASAGTFNINVLRPLWRGRIMLANAMELHDFIRTGMPEVFGDSALYCMIAADSTTSGLPYCEFDISQG